MAASSTVDYGETAYAAAQIEDHLREALRLAREQYGPDERGARQWVLLALMDAMGLPERAGYPTMDYLDRMPTP